VVCASRYCDDRVVQGDEEPWTPAADAGELRLRFLLSPGDPALPQQARLLEEPVIAMPVPSGAGHLPRTGTLLRLAPGSLRVVALRPAGDGSGVIITLQAADGRAASASIVWMGSVRDPGRVPAGRLATWRLTRPGSGWSAAPASALESASS
jgi:hypothetical protein